MKKDYQELLHYLQRLEDELRSLGWWSEAAPDAEAFHSTAPFCHDRMTLEQWLQWIFIPQLRQLLRSGSRLPENCAIKPMAELTWAEQPAETTRTLLELLFSIDNFISQAA